MPGEFFDKKKLKQKRKERNNDAVAKSSKKKMILAILLISIAVPVVIYFGFFGSIFQGPPAPPAEFEQGYALINFYDPYAGAPVDNVQLYIRFINGTDYLEVTSGAVFQVPAASYFFAMKTGYWNGSGAVFAKGELPNEAYNQTYSISSIPSMSNVTFNIVAIDGVYGGYTADGIPDGTHTLKIVFNSSVSAWGPTAYLPPSWIPSGSYADSLGVWIQSLWIGWNGTIENYQYQGGPPEAFHVFDTGIYNTTKIYALHFTGEITITATFKDISNAVLYFGLIDPLLSHAIIPF